MPLDSESLRDLGLPIAKGLTRIRHRDPEECNCLARPVYRDCKHIFLDRPASELQHEVNNPKPPILASAVISTGLELVVVETEVKGVPARSA